MITLRWIFCESWPLWQSRWTPTVSRKKNKSQPSGGKRTWKYPHGHSHSTLKCPEIALFLSEEHWLVPFGTQLFVILATCWLQVYYIILPPTNVNKKQARMRTIALHCDNPNTTKCIEDFHNCCAAKTLNPPSQAQNDQELPVPANVRHTVYPTPDLISHHLELIGISMVTNSWVSKVLAWSFVKSL